MSYYHKFDFISPEPLYANIKEELKSYFDAGIVDDTMFPVWTDKCLKKIGRAALAINQGMLNVCEHKADLPEDFHAIREAWSCTSYDKSFQLPSATYEQVKSISTRIDRPADYYCNLCRECEIPDVIEVIYKTTNTVAFSVKRTHLLTPGIIYPACPNDLYCANRGATSLDSYDIRDGKFTTSFKEGIVYIQYYANSYDKADNQLIPDNYRVREYIEAFIKSKIFEQVFNQTTDETFNQSQLKWQTYKQLADEAYILVDIELKKGDIYKQFRNINRQRRRFNRFKIW